MGERAFRVVGGTALRGEAAVWGAKNSALKLMAVALLAVGRTRLTNVPAIPDVTIMAELLRRLGCTTSSTTPAAWSSSTCPSAYRPPRRLRARPGPACLDLGARAARGPHRPADVAVPGGDAIGSRGLDLHAAGLEALGARVHVTHGLPRRRRPSERPTVPTSGSTFPSVGSHRDVLTGSVLARGTTRSTTSRGAGDRRHRRDAHLDGRPDQRGGHLGGRGAGRRQPDRHRARRRPGPHRCGHVGVRRLGHAR